MRVLHGTKVLEAGAGWRNALLRDGRRIVIDLGAGDGRYAYESARADTSAIYVAVDPDADALGEYAFRAARKPSRGGVENARFVVASVEQLPPELHGLAHTVRVNFPWGGLLRGLIAPDARTLRSVASLAAPGGRFEIIASYDPAHDHGAFSGDPLPSLDASYIESALMPAYAAAGLTIEQSQRLTQDEALAVPSTWGRRLLHARPREVYLIAGHVSQPD